MTRISRRGRTALATLATIILACAAPALVAAGERLATLEAYRGRVSVVRAGVELRIYPAMALEREDLVVTRRGVASVRFATGGTLMRVGRDSRVEIDHKGGDNDVKLFAGRLWARVLKWRETSGRSKFRSGGTIVAVRGTELTLTADGEAATVAVLEGEVLAENSAGSATVAQGSQAVVTAGGAPVVRVMARPRDAVRWAIYYLPVIYMAPDELAGGGWREAVRASTERYFQGDLAGALDALADVDDGSIGDSRFFTYRASLLLAAGSLDAAEAELVRVERMSRDSSDALALRTIIAVADNRLEEALELARRAVAADGASATAQIALSYALQARFDLVAARDSLEKAVELAPDNALAWARLAELHSSFGNRSAALAAAAKAVALEPGLARTQTVLGFAYLMRVQTTEAKASFRRAIELDASDPLPRLGLGLARIREGNLAAGALEIELATSLDPSDGLIRSYLGKAAFEQKKTGVDAREYALAKELDPNDPTPWFYDAITKQTTNRPVEALMDLQRAIELNDNRAVYRSRLLLDSDLAARNASLGRVYSDLGFQHLALVQGWRSVNTDPSNSSAHRLLADSYAARPRHEIARVSELLQSQLLQPINTTPIQPRLGESNLFLLSAQGPAIASFNEFNPMFMRDQVNLQVNGLGGENETGAGEAIVSGVYKRGSFSAGYSRYETGGFRVNEDQEDEIGNVYGQVEVGPATSIQGEYRYRKLERGDLELRFDPERFRPELRETTEAKTYRLGLKHAISPGSVILASYIHQDSDTLFTDGFDPIAGIDGITLDIDERSDSFEGQYLYRTGAFNLTAGVGYFDIAIDEVSEIFIDLPPPPFGPGPIVDVFEAERRIDHTNAYGYANLDLPSEVTLTLGVSGDFFEEEGGGVGDEKQANPKVGVTWNPRPRTTVRGAVFRALKRTLITDQTLEPTQVAGFNQFYDDPSGTESWVYGAAVDQIFSPRHFAGAELARRDLDIPRTFFSDTGETLFGRADQDETLGRLYYFSTPRPWLSLSAEYLYEKIERSPELFLGFENVRSHWLPLAAQFFHPSGLGGSFRATFLDQSGDFLDADGIDFAAGSRNFWVLDAAVRYRLPRRYGLLSAGVNNLTDEDSTYEATDPANPTIRPGRAFYASVTLALP